MDSKEHEFKNIIEKLSQRYGGTFSEGFESLDFRSGPVHGYVRLISEGNSLVFLLATGPVAAEKSGLNSAPSYEESDELLDNLKKVLPGKPDSNHSLRAGYARDEEEAAALIRSHAATAGRTLRTSGLVRNCILAMLRAPIDIPLSTPSREFSVVSYGQEPEAAGETVWTLCFEVCSLATHIGKMSRLYSERRLMFDQMDASERSTQLRINEILADMRRPVDEIQPDNLENILKEVTIQFSRLSTLASSMRRDLIRAQGFYRSLRNLLREWNERPYDESLTNSSVELEYFERLMSPFGDFVERTEALMTQLNTVLDSVRTYLGIQQQKMSLMEQTSSKEQLIRLVNLQEILHKVEVLIVAVYITEMAKIAFETLIHEHETVNFLTAVFIPIALLLSVLLSRILHKGH